MAAKSKPATKSAAVNGPSPESVGGVLTLAEAAALLRVPEEGLRTDAEAGRVPGRLVAGEWRFIKSTLLEWLSSEGQQRPEPQWSGGPIRKANPVHLNQGFLDAIGAFAHDESLEPLIQDIYRHRKQPAQG